MAESAHRVQSVPEPTIYPEYAERWAREDRATAATVEESYPPPVVPFAIGGGLVDVDWYQILAAGFAPALRAVTVEERAAACTHLKTLLDEVAGAAHLGPFEAEEEAAGALVVALLQYAQARGFSLWSAIDRALTDLAVTQGLRFLADTARP